MALSHVPALCEIGAGLVALVSALPLGASAVGELRPSRGARLLVRRPRSATRARPDPGPGKRDAAGGSTVIGFARYPPLALRPEVGWTPQPSWSRPASSGNRVRAACPLLAKAWANRAAGSDRARVLLRLRGPRIAIHRRFERDARVGRARPRGWFSAHVPSIDWAIKTPCPASVASSEASTASAHGFRAPGTSYISRFLLLPSSRFQQSRTERARYARAARRAARSRSRVVPLGESVPPTPVPPDSAWARVEKNDAPYVVCGSNLPPLPIFLGASPPDNNANE